MAALALQFAEGDVPPMRIEDMIGLSVKSLPDDLLALLCKLPDFLFFRALGDGLFMAFQTGG